MWLSLFFQTQSQKVPTDSTPPDQERQDTISPTLEVILPPLSPPPPHLILVLNFRYVAMYVFVHMQSSDEDSESNDGDSCAANQMLNKDQASQSNRSAEEDKATVIHKWILGSFSTF